MAAKRAVSGDQSTPVSRGSKTTGFKDKATLAKEGWKEYFEEDGTRIIGRDSNHPSFSELPRDKISARVTVKIIDVDTKEKPREYLPAPKPKDRYLLKAFFDSYNLAEIERDPLVSIFQREIMRVLNHKAKLELPTAAPKLYKDRPNGQNIIDFLRDPDGWGPYVTAGILTRPVLRRLDWPAYKALDNWQRTKHVPAEVKLPTGKQVNDAALAAADAPQRAREGARLVAAIHYRQKANPN